MLATEGVSVGIAKKIHKATIYKSVPSAQANLTDTEYDTMMKALQTCGRVMQAVHETIDKAMELQSDVADLMEAMLTREAVN